MSKPFLQGAFSSAMHGVKERRREQLRIGVKLFIPPFETGREINEAVCDASRDEVEKIEVRDRSSEQAGLCEGSAEGCTLMTRVCQTVSRAILPMNRPPTPNLTHKSDPKLTAVLNQFQEDINVTK